MSWCCFPPTDKLNWSEWSPIMQYFLSTNNGSLWRSTQLEWKLTFGSDLRNKNSVFQEHSYRGEEVCFPQIAEQRLIIPHFFCTSVAAVREISSMHEQKLRAALFDSPTQLSDWTFFFWQMFCSGHFFVVIATVELFKLSWVRLRWGRGEDCPLQEKK